MDNGAEADASTSHRAVLLTAGGTPQMNANISTEMAPRALWQPTSGEHLKQSPLTERLADKRGFIEQVRVAGLSGFVIRNTSRAARAPFNGN